MATEHRRADHVALGVFQHVMLSLVILEEDSIANVQGKNKGWRSKSGILKVDSEVLSRFETDSCLADCMLRISTVEFCLISEVDPGDEGALTAAGRALWHCSAGVTRVNYKVGRISSGAYLV